MRHCSTLATPIASKRQEKQASAQADALGDHGRYERHEDDGHWQAVPHQACVVRCEMVVGRTEGSQQHSAEHERVRPAFAGAGEGAAFSRLRPKEEDQAPDANQGEPQVRCHVAEVRDPEQAPLACELVVGQRLGNRRQEKRNNRDWIGRSRLTVGLTDGLDSTRCG